MPQRKPYKSAAKPAEPAKPVSAEQAKPRPVETVSALKARTEIPGRMDGMDQKLQTVIPDGFKGRWVNDRGNRISQMQAKGWRMLGRDEQDNPLEVTDKGDTSAITEYVGEQKNGSPMYAYLMVLEDWAYEETQNKKAERQSAKEQQILGGDPEVAGVTEKDFYAKEENAVRRV